MQLDAVPPQPQPKDKPGPHSPQPDPIPQVPPRRALNDRPFETHEEAPLRWEMSKMFPGMVCRKPTVHTHSMTGYGYIKNHRSVVA